MAYKGHDSTFDPIVAIIAAVANPADTAQVANLTKRVNDMLTDRFPEEVEGKEELRIDFARARIAGTLAMLDDLRTRAVQCGALPEFIAAINRVRDAGVAAHSRAPARDQDSSRKPEPAAWATAPIEPATTAPVGYATNVYDLFRDI